MHRNSRLKRKFFFGVRGGGEEGRGCKGRERKGRGGEGRGGKGREGKGREEKEKGGEERGGTPFLRSLPPPRLLPHFIYTSEFRHKTDDSPASKQITKFRDQSS